MAHCDAVGWSRPHHQVDPGQRRRQLSQVGGRGPNDTGKLAEGPMRRRDRLMCLRQHQVQPLGVVARGFDADVRRLHDPAAAALGAALHIGPEIVEREIPLVIRPVEPFGRHPPVPLPPAHINLVAARLHRPHGGKNFHVVHGSLSVTGAGSLSPGLGPSLAKRLTLTLYPAGAHKGTKASNPINYMIILHKKATCQLATI